MSAINNEQIEVILKSIKYQKQYSLEAGPNDRLSDIATFLKSLNEVGKFQDTNMIIFMESATGKPIPHFTTLGELLRSPSKKVELFVEAIETAELTSKIKSKACCSLF